MDRMLFNFITFKNSYMDLDLKDKVIIVSGGAKGIGEGIVKVLAAEGAIPVIIGRNEADNMKTVKEVEAAGGRASQVVAELSEPCRMRKSHKSGHCKIWPH